MSWREVTRGEAPRFPGQWSNHLAFEAVTGSHAYGLATSGSDIDWRGVYLAPSEEWWRVHEPQEVLHASGGGVADPKSGAVSPRWEATWWEGRHFLRQLLKGAQNAHELLWLPSDWIARREPFYDALRGIREELISQNLWKAWMGTYRSYLHELGLVESKRKVLEPGPARDKHAANLLRYAIGMWVLADQRVVTVRLTDEHRTWCREIRAGEWDLNRVYLQAEVFAKTAEELHRFRPFEPLPNLAAADRVLLGFRRAVYRLPC